MFFLFFFFQAEDGIRDKLVTGVQTCALPISPRQVLLPAADLARRHTILSRNLENAGNRTWRGGDNGAGAALAEEGEFGGGRVIQADACAKQGRNMLRPFGRAYGSETRFG